MARSRCRAAAGHFGPSSAGRGPQVDPHCFRARSTPPHRDPGSVRTAGALAALPREPALAARPGAGAGSGMPNPRSPASCRLASLRRPRQRLRSGTSIPLPGRWLSGMAVAVAPGPAPAQGGPRRAMGRRSRRGRITGLPRAFATQRFRGPHAAAPVPARPSVAGQAASEPHDPPRTCRAVRLRQADGICATSPSGGGEDLSGHGARPAIYRTGAPGTSEARQSQLPSFNGFPGARACRRARSVSLGLSTTHTAWLRDGKAAAAAALGKPAATWQRRTAAPGGPSKDGAPSAAIGKPGRGGGSPGPLRHLPAYRIFVTVESLVCQTGLMTSPEMSLRMATESVTWEIGWIGGASASYSSRIRA